MTRSRLFSSFKSTSSNQAQGDSDLHNHEYNNVSLDTPDCAVVDNMPPVAHAVVAQADDDTADTLSSEDSRVAGVRNYFKTRRRASRQKVPQDLKLSLTSRRYDLSGKGALDEAERAMRNHDKDNRGYLTNEEIYEIVQEQLESKKGLRRMQKIVIGLVCFTIVLALSNLGTSFASAILANDTQEQGDNLIGKRTGEIIGTQSAGEIHEIERLTPEERRRHLKRCEDERSLKKRGRDKRNSSCGVEDVPVGTMKRSQVEKISRKCEASKTVSLKRVFLDGSTDADNVCMPGTSSTMKKRRNKDIYTFKTNGKTVVFDCDGDVCNVYGTAFMQDEFEPCDIADQFTGGGCRPGFQCLVEDDSEGVCVPIPPPPMWYANWENFTCVQDCPKDGLNCGGKAEDFNELFVSPYMCCETHMGWKRTSKCIPSPETLGTVVADGVTYSGSGIKFVDGTTLYVGDDKKTKKARKRAEESNMDPILGTMDPETSSCSGAGHPCFTPQNEFACCSGRCTQGVCS